MRPPPPSRLIPCALHTAPAGTPCAVRARGTPWDCQARRVESGMVVYPGGKSMSGAAKRRRKKHRHDPVHGAMMCDVCNPE